MGILTMLTFITLYLLRKNDNTLKQHNKIDEAIYQYRMYCHKKDIAPKVDYSDKENYYTTLWRLWDWSGKRILPQDKYETIKPFIEKE